MNPVHQDSARAELYWLPLGASAARTRTVIRNG